MSILTMCKQRLTTERRKKKLTAKEKPNEKNPSAMKPSGNVNGHRTKT